MRTVFVLDALEQALYARQPERNGSLVCHSDRGSQHASIRYTERLAEAGIEPSVGSKGDSYDNALAETIMACTRQKSFTAGYPGKPRRRCSLQRSNGCHGSTTIACSNPSGISRLLRLRQTTTGYSPIRPSAPSVFWLIFKVFAISSGYWRPPFHPKTAQAMPANANHN